MHHSEKYRNATPFDNFNSVVIGALLLCLFGWGTPAGAARTRAAPPEVTAALTTIAELREAVSAHPAGSPARGSAIAELLEAERQLLQNFTNDPRVPIWQGDLAFDLLFLAGTESGLDLIIEFGLPTEAQSNFFRALATEAGTLTDDAAAGVADLVLELEDAAEFQSSAKLQQRRRQLVNDELRKRLPYLAATAQYYQAIAAFPRPQVTLTATVNTPQTATLTTEQRKHLQEVEFLAEDLELLLEDPYRTRLRVLAGSAACQRGENLLGERLLARAESSLTLPPTVRMRIFLQRQRIKPTSETITEPAWLRTNPFYQLLRGDFEFRQRLKIPAENSPLTARWDWLLAAYEPFLSNNSLALSNEARARAVGEQISRAIPTTIPISELPPLVLLAQAGKQLQDPTRRAAAVNSLRTLLNRPELADWVEPRTKYLLATALLADERPLEAAQSFYELARNFPSSADGLNALEQALIILTPELNRPTEETSEKTAELFELASRLALHEMPTLPNFAQWMYLRGQFELRRENFPSAREALTQITAESEWYLPAAFKIAQTHYHEARTAELAAGNAASQSWAQAIATGEHARALLQIELTEETNPNNRERLENSADTLRALIADANLRNHNPTKALDTLADLDLQTPRANRRTETLAELLRIRIDALLALERDTEADDELQALANNDPARALPILTRMVSGLYQELLQRELADGDPEAIKISAAERLLPLTTLALTVTKRLAQDEDSTAGTGTPHTAVLRFHAAEAQRLAGQFQEAHRILLELKLAQPNSADILTAYAESCYQLQADAEALRSFNRVSQALRNTRSWRFWLAELRTLQIFERTNQRTERIFPRIQRLRLNDPQLGGKRFQPEFRRLENRYAP